MAHTVQPHVQTVSVSHKQRSLVLALLAVVVLTATVLIFAIGGSGGSSAPRTSAPGTGFSGGPAAGTPSAVSQALRHTATARRPFPIAPTTNVPAKVAEDAGPTPGTPAAVRDALSGR